MGVGDDPRWEQLRNDVFLMNMPKRRKAEVLGEYIKGRAGTDQAAITANAGVAKSRVAAQGGIEQQLIQKSSDVETTGMRETGGTLRTNLTNAANTLMERMKELGLGNRQKSLFEHNYQTQQSEQAFNKSALDTLAASRPLDTGGGGGYEDALADAFPSTPAAEKVAAPGGGGVVPGAVETEQQRRLRRWKEENGDISAWE